jgi:hypothetical protein
MANKTGQRVHGQIKNDKFDSIKNEPVELGEVMSKLLSGEDIYEVVKTKRGAFRMVYPRPRLLRAADMLLSDRFNNIDLNKLPSTSIRQHEVYCILDVVIVEGPRWWEELDSSEDCPDEELITELYRGYLRFHNKVQQKISTGGERSGSGNTGKSSGIEKEDVADGTFSDITHGQKVSGTDGKTD